MIYPKDLMEDPRFVNQSRNERRTDKFYVKFPDLPENIGNFLGSQIINITRPRYSVSTFNISKRANRYPNLGAWELMPITVTFSEDSNAFTEILLTNQILRQVNQLPDMNGLLNGGNERDVKFDMEITLYNESGEATSEYKLKDCFIAEFEPEPLSTGADGAESTIDCVIHFDAIQLKVYEKWIELKNK